MKIPSKVFKKWKELKDHGDITKMANGDSNLRVYISNAFSTKECSEDVFRTIKTFYQQKESKREALIKTA